MSETLSPVPKIDLYRLEASQAIRVPQAVHNSAAKALHSPEAASVEDAEEMEKPQAVAQADRGPFRDITIRFEVDDETHDVTLLILDRATRKVIRSIPPEEMTRMGPGELLELFT